MDNRAPGLGWLRLPAMRSRTPGMSSLLYIETLASLHPRVGVYLCTPVQGQDNPQKGLDASQSQSTMQIGRYPRIYAAAALLLRSQKRVLGCSRAHRRVDTR